MLRQTQDSFQLSTNLTKNFIQKITRIKPLVPRVIATSIVVVMLMLGIGNQYFVPITGCVLFATAQSDIDDILADKSARFITLSGSTNRESGEPLAEGSFWLLRRDKDKVLQILGVGTTDRPRGDVDINDPTPMYMLMRYIFHVNTDLFRFPLVLGNTWTQQGADWALQVQTTLEGYEQVDVSAGTFSDCLKHKTVFTEAKAGSPLKSSLVNGTRYLWFAKGIGIVKMRYEHSNGTITEAELLESDVPVKGEDYFPLQVGNMWIYKWQNDYRDVTIEKCQVVENTYKFPFPVPDQDNTVPESERMELASARYEVKIDADERRVAHVKGILTPKEGSGDTLLLSMSTFGTEDLDDGYARYLRDLTVTAANEEELPIEKLGKTRWAVKVKNKTPVAVSYKILLNHDERIWPPGRSETPYVQEDCIFLTGNALFIVGEVSDIELHIDVPNNWRVSTPWHHVGDKGHRFALKDQNDLQSAYLVLGTHSEKVAKSEAAEVVVAVGGRFKAAAAEIQGTVEAFLKAYSGVFDGTPKGKILFVANPYGEQLHLDGGASGHSLSVIIGGTLETAKHFWMPFVGHEVLHIWNAEAISFSGHEEYWFMEGFTEYYSNIVSARLGFISESDFLKILESWCESYLSTQGELSLREAGRNKSGHKSFIYCGGSLIAAALDVQIRKLTQNQKNLDDVMKQMYKEFGITGETYTVDDVIRVVSDIAGESFESFFRKYVSGTERLPLAEYLEGAGLDVVVDEGLPNIGYIRREMLHIQSLTQAPTGGLIIDKSPMYQDGDNLVAINGKPVNTYNDIRKIAKGWTSGGVVELTLERKGEEIALPVTLGEIPEKLPIGEAIVTIDRNADSTDFQRAIWSGILGTSQ